MKLVQFYCPIGQRFAAIVTALKEGAGHRFALDRDWSSGAYKQDATRTDPNENGMYFVEMLCASAFLGVAYFSSLGSWIRTPLMLLFTWLTLYYLLFYPFLLFIQRRREKAYREAQESEQAWELQRAAEAEAQHENEVRQWETRQEAAAKWLADMQLIDPSLKDPLNSRVHYLDRAGNLVELSCEAFIEWVQANREKNPHQVPQACLYEKAGLWWTSSPTWKVEGLDPSDLIDSFGNCLTVRLEEEVPRESAVIAETLRIIASAHSVREYALQYRAALAAEEIGKTARGGRTNAKLKGIRELLQDTSLEPFAITYRPDLLAEATQVA